jgi:CopG family nickel-responsive transcriptional regulator
MKKGEETIRFGVSMPSALVDRFDRHLARRNYRNRSEAIRDLVRQALIDSEIHTNKVVVGVIHLLYDHHRRELAEQLTEIQHAKHELIISTTHVHLDHQHCLEVILCRGKAAQISQLADALIAVKGVSNGHLYLTTAV